MRLKVGAVAASFLLLGGSGLASAEKEDGTGAASGEVGSNFMVVRAVSGTSPDSNSDGGGNGGGDDDSGGGFSCDSWFAMPGGTPDAAGVKVENGITHDLYFVGSSCAGGTGAGGRFAYVQRIEAADLLPGLRDEMRRKLPVPEPRFEALDSEFGWAYVTVPVDFRVENLEPVSVSASASAGPMSVWATMTATPSGVTFEPGEPRGNAVGCTVGGAQAGYDPERPGECAYTYVDSSAVSSNGRTFSTTMSVEWTIAYDSSSGPGSFPAVTLSASEDLAVAEIQALVTCTGPRPEQGGCG